MKVDQTADQMAKKLVVQKDFWLVAQWAVWKADRWVYKKAVWKAGQKADQMA